MAVRDGITTLDDLGNPGIKQTMTSNRFQEISQFLHFPDSTRTPAHGKNGYDQLYKVRLVLNAILENSQRCYSPNKHIAIDEGMIALKGRLSFRQYMPAKPTKCGIKVWMTVDSKEWLRNKLRCLPWKWGRHSKNSRTWLRCRHENDSASREEKSSCLFW